MRRSLSVVKRNKHNRFFFRTGVLLQLGLRTLDADLLSKVVCALLKKHRRHWLVFSFLQKSIRYYRQSGLLNYEGLGIRVAGKINGYRRKRRRFLKFGVLPLQGLAHDIGYSYRVVVTKFGVFGVRVWVLRKQTHGFMLGIHYIVDKLSKPRKQR